MLDNLFKKQFTRYFSIRLIGMVCVTLGGMGVSIATARVLGPDGKGIYTLLYSTITMTVALLGLKLSFGQAYYRKDAGSEELTGVTNILSLASGLLAVLLAAPVVLLLGSVIYEGVPVRYLWISLGMVPFLLLAFNLRTLIDAHYKIIPGTIITVVRPFVFLMLFLPAIPLGHATLEWAVYSFAAGIIGMLLLSVYFITRITGFVFFSYNSELAGKMTRFGLRSHIGLIFNAMQDRFDIFLVAFFMTPRDVGIYSVALALVEVLYRLPRVAASVLLPRLSKEEKQQKSILLTARLNRVIFWSVLLLAMTFSLIVGWAINFLFGTEFAGARSAALIMLPGLMFQTLYSISHNDLIMRGHASKYSFAVFLGLVTMVSADVWLIPLYGINGAAAASSFGWFVTGSYLFTNMVRSNTLPLIEYFDIRSEVRALIMIFR